MPLSEYEQRVLQQMEQQLRSEDPKLASDFGSRPRIDARRILVAVALVVAGLAALLGGVTLSSGNMSWIWLGVVGFALMLAGVMVLVNGARTGAPGAREPRRRPTQPAHHGATGESFMKRQAEKWERRQEGGGH